MNMTTLSVEGITRRYGEKTVIWNFSHAFPREGVVLLRGPSGSGKTTLLRLLAGLEQPDEGRILLPGGAKIAMVFQENRLLPTLDARGNILAAIGSGEGGENIRKADEMLRLVGLAGEERRYPAELSGGMRRRVAIARALAFGGDLLLLDEPFKGLDAALKRQVMDLVFADRRRLILFATHDPGEMEQADHILSADQWSRPEGPGKGR